MKKITGRFKKLSYSHYLAFFTLLLLLGAIFVTISNTLQKQALRSKAASSAAILPPGAVGPSDAQCAEQVAKTAESIPDNQTANNTNAAIAGYKLTGSLLGTFGAPYEERVTGNFSGTTDEILQWGACKWGFDADTARAMAVGLSKWKQSALGDCNNQGQIQPETNGCQSVGIMRVKAANIPPAHPGTWPYAKTSTAFNVDYALGILRACYDGKQTSLGAGYAAGDENGCIGAWYSGAWHDGSAEGFILGVQNIKQTKEWTTYAGTGSVSPMLSTAPNIVPSIVPSTPVVSPPFYPLAPCPTCSSPSISPMGGGLTPGASSAPAPSIPSEPAPSTDPCLANDTSISDDDDDDRPHGKRHKKHKGGISGMMEALFKFILELLSLILQLLGGGQVNNPNPQSPGDISPDPQPQPCDPFEVPSGAPQISSVPTPSQPVVSGTPSIGVNPSVSPAPSQTAGGISPSPALMPSNPI